MCVDDVIADLSERTDEAGQADNTAISEQFSHFRDTSNVFFTIFRTKSQVLIETMAYVVSVQTVWGNSLTDQVALQCKRQCRLSSTRQSCRLYTKYTQQLAVMSRVWCLVSIFIKLLINSPCFAEMEMVHLLWPMTRGHYIISSDTHGNRTAWHGGNGQPWRSWEQKIVH